MIGVAGSGLDVDADLIDSAGDNDCFQGLDNRLELAVAVHLIHKTVFPVHLVEAEVVFEPLSVSFDLGAVVCKLLAFDIYD